MLLPYVGYQLLHRDLEWDGWSNAMAHSGLRLGVMGSIELAERLDFIYDIAFCWCQVQSIGGFLRRGRLVELGIQRAR